MVQGDDVAVNIDTYESALRVVNTSDQLGGIMNPSKIIYRTDGSLDFLRTFYSTRDKVAHKYLARALASNLQFKPWSSPREQSLVDVISSWQMIYSRGGHDEQLLGLQELNNVLEQRMAKKL